MKDKTVFIEYSSSERGQHFMTVIHIDDGKRTIIGRVFRSYDKEAKKTTYLAQDAMGNQVFNDTKDLTTLKKNFIEHGKTLAMILPRIPKREKQPVRQNLPMNTNRGSDLKSIRERNTPKIAEKKEPEKTQNNNPEKQERKEYKDPDLESFEGQEHAYGVPTAVIQDKDLERIHQQYDEDEKEQQWIDDFENNHSEYFGDPTDERSERDQELDEIRSQDTDMDRDYEMERDI